ncbi:MAG: diguanylate cyclase [Lachnospiraceae bacterium]|nr:diguanylate cyclase [Lachnospiraceae bacterium]
MKHILVVDEDSSSLEIIRSTLGGTYRVTELNTGPQVLQFLTTRVPDLILMELRLTVMDGFELMGRIRENEATKKVPIVCISKRDPETEERALTMAAGFIAKPFVPSALLAQIGEIMGAVEQQRSLGGMMQGEGLQAVIDESQRDSLTGLWNWNAAMQMVDMRLNSGYSGALFMIDMDNYKAFSDVYGPQSGDLAMQMVARTMMDNAATDDVVCRVFGDLFMAFYSGVTDRPALIQRAETLIRDFGAKILESRFDANTSLSIGIALAPEDARDFVHLYSNADKALYFVKQSGKHSYHFYSKAMDSDTVTTNLWTLQENFSSVIPAKGAYLLDVRGFQYVYNFMHRRAERGQIDARMVLFTLAPDQGYLPKKDELEKAVERLDQALYSTLRRGDVSTQYSGRQVLVILLDITEEACTTVVQRVAMNYEKMDPSGRIHLLYETIALGADIMAAQAAAPQ